MIGNGTDDDIVELFHADPSSFTEASASTYAVATGIVSVLTRFSGRRGHAAAAAFAATSAHHMACQQIRLGLDGCRTHSRVTRGSESLSAIEGFFGDDSRDGNRNPFVLGTKFANTGIALIKIRCAHVSGIVENALHVRHVERTPSDPLTLLIEQLGQTGNPDGPLRGAVEVSFKDEPRNVNRIGIDLEFLAIFALGLRH